MTIVLENNYHAKKALEERRVACLSHEQAIHADIRALRIGILNIMPHAETYEYNLLFPLGRSVIQIEPVWIRLKTHAYKSTDKNYLAQHYINFEDAMQEKPLDALIVSGAPVEEIPFNEVSYWQEITEICNYARKHIASTLGICWGGLALANFLNIERELYSEKKFGVFETKNINRKHRITGELDDIFHCPVSSHSGIADSVMEKAKDEGSVNLLAHAEEAGYLIFESSDQKFLMHLGHPEYEAQRLVDEYERDKELGRKDVTPPEYVDLQNPLNCWRGHCLEFYAQWIKFVHEETTH